MFPGVILCFVIVASSDSFQRNVDKICSKFVHSYSQTGVLDDGSCFVQKFAIGSFIVESLNGVQRGYT